MAMFGPDFQRAKSGWLYPQQKQQSFWRALGLFVFLFLFFQFLQLAFSLLIFVFGFGQPLSSLANVDALKTPTILTAFLISMFPAAVPTFLLGLYLRKFGLQHREGSLPLRFPLLGVGGWATVILGFVILMWALMNSAYWLNGFDNAQNTGLVENIMAEMAKQPFIFILALPSIILAAPFVEEYLFRGILFAGLATTFVGKTGAVIITAALWSLAHAGPAPWINVGLIFVMGLVLGGLLLRFGSLWVTIACHLVWNSLTSLALFVVGSSL